LKGANRSHFIINNNKDTIYHSTNSPTMLRTCSFSRTALTRVGAKAFLATNGPAIAAGAIQHLGGVHHSHSAGSKAFFSTTGPKMLAADAIQKLVNHIDKDKVKFLRLQFSDLVGHPKNVSIPVTQVERALKHGVGFDGSSIQGFVRIEESDMILKPDPSTYALLPWRPQDGRVARFICDVYGTNDEPFVGDPRNVLKQVVLDAESLGFDLFCVGPEMEFFLFKTDQEGKPTTEFQDLGHYFSFSPTDKASDVRRGVVLALTEMGFDIEASHHEVAESQHEIDFRFCNALRAADNVITFKYATKSIAHQNDLHATFMAKPLEVFPGILCTILQTVF
jgi:glutamine synthetase